MGTDAAANDKPFPPRYRWLKRISVAAGIYLLAIAGLRLVLGYIADRKLKATIAALRATGEPLLPEDFVYPQLKDEENAAWYFNQAAKVLVPNFGPAFATGAIQIDLICSDRDLVLANMDEVGELIKVNKPAFDLVFKGCECNRSDMGIRVGSFAMTGVSPGRAVAKLLCARAQYSLASGDVTDGIASLEQVLVVSRSISSPPTSLLQHLVAIACDAMAVGVIEDWLPQPVEPNESDAKSQPPSLWREAGLRLARHLVNDTPLRQSIVSAGQTEMALYYHIMSVLIDGKAPFGSLATLAITPSPMSIFDRAELFLMDPVWKRDGGEYLRHGELFRTACGRTSFHDATQLVPYQGSKSRSFNFGISISKAVVVKPFSTIFPSDSLSRVLFQHYLALARRQMGGLALAAKVYQFDHGSWPNSLSELTPDYIPELPSDPFSEDQQSYGYLPSGPLTLIYSLGTDGDDDGGRYGVRPDGSVDVNVDDGDLVFFLNGKPPKQRDP